MIVYEFGKGSQVYIGWFIVIYVVQNRLFVFFQVFFQFIVQFFRYFLVKKGLDEVFVQVGVGVFIVQQIVQVGYVVNYIFVIVQVVVGICFDDIGNVWVMFVGCMGGFQQVVVYFNVCVFKNLVQCFLYGVFQLGILVVGVVVKNFICFFCGNFWN